MEPSARTTDLCLGALRFVEQCDKHAQSENDSHFFSALCVMAATSSDETLGACLLFKQLVLEENSAASPDRLEALAERFTPDVEEGGASWMPSLKLYLSIGEFIVATVEQFLAGEAGRSLKTMEWRAHLLESATHQFKEKITRLEVALSSSRLVPFKPKKRRRSDAQDDDAGTPEKITMTEGDLPVCVNVLPDPPS